MGCGASKELAAAPPPANTPTAQPQAEPQPRTTGTGQARQPEPAKPTNSLQEPGNSLEEAAKECLRAHEAEAGISPHSGEKWAQSWDGGVSFHYGQPGTDNIPADSARHRAEAEAFRCVAAQDAADAPDQASREVGMVNRGVYVWWLLLYAGTVDPKLTTAEVVAQHVKPMTSRRRCRFVECEEMEGKTGRATVFISHTWGARFRELVSAIAYGLPRDACVWIDIFAVRQWPGNVADIDFRPVVLAMNAVLLIARHSEQVAAVSKSSFVYANVQLNVVGAESEPKKLQLARRNGALLPSDDLQACSFFRIWCVVELVAALLGNVPVILLVGAEDLTVYKATSSLESEGAPIGAFQPNPAMLDTLVEMVDVGKAVASVEADRVRELGHVKEQVGVIPANCKAKGAIVAANHTMGVVPVLHATATRSLDPLRALDAQHGPALLASAAIGLVEGVELLLASAGAQETAGQALELSSAAGHPKVVLTILDHLGVKGSSDMTETTETAFLEACQGGHASVAQVFLDRGIDTELRTNNQWTPLILAALCGSVELLELLLDRGAEINAADGSKWTAIIWASDRQQYDAVKFLFDRGAIPFGCMQWAKAPPIVDLLTSNGCERGDNQKLDMENGKVFVKPEFL